MNNNTSYRQGNESDTNSMTSPGYNTPFRQASNQNSGNRYNSGQNSGGAVYSPTRGYYASPGGQTTGGYVPFTPPRNNINTPNA